ncbi:competence/damage-inducible protein A [Jatrophihabitans sp. YIM 134969]
MTVRAAVVVTGTEVLTGRVADRNGPWLAEALRAVGVDVAQIVVVGDRPEDLRATLGFLSGSGVDLVLTSGGLGPTADDLTAVVVGDFQGRPSALDTDLEARIGAIVARLAAGRGWRMDPETTAVATRKQAMVPRGATVLEPVGTAPGLVVPPAEGDGPPVVVLPGPPRELQGMWPAVLSDATVRAVLARAGEIRQSTVRMWGTPESEIAATLRDLDTALDGLEITTCLRDGGELEVVTRYDPSAQPTYDAFVERLEQAYPRTVFSPGGATVDELVVAALTARGWTLGVGESCTGGLLTGRLSERAGSSAYLQGGTVAYSNDAKVDLLGVDPALFESVGAVSAEVAEAMARGAAARFGADVGLGVTGIAGPGGGTAEKPVGLVHLCVVTPANTLARRLNIPGARPDVRSRAVSAALHLLLDVLTAP